MLCYAIALFLYQHIHQVLAVIPLKYEQSLICTKCQQPEDLCILCFDVIQLDVSVEAIHVSLQWTRRSLAILVSVLKRFHLYSKTALYAAQIKLDTASVM